MSSSRLHLRSLQFSLLFPLQYFLHWLQFFGFSLHLLGL